MAMARFTSVVVLPSLGIELVIAMTLRGLVDVDELQVRPQLPEGFRPRRLRILVHRERPSRHLRSRAR